MEPTESLKIEMDGALAVVTVNRPARRNMIDVATATALTAFFRKANTDRAVRAIVVTGEGKDFCTGGDGGGGSADAAAMKMATLDYRWGVEPFSDLFKAMWEVEKPVVSAVNGAVAGLGWMLALLADLVVAAEGGRWTHVFTRIGMAPHAGDPYFLPRLIPFHRLNEIALLGGAVTSDTLSTWGLVNRLVPKEQVLATALELGRKLSEGPTRSLGQTKRMYRLSLESDLTTMYREEKNVLALLSTTEDRVEGVKAMVEGRAAKFSGN